MYWMISANSNMYDHASSFAHYGYIDWRQGNPKFSVGDIVYIYCTSPAKKIRYKCQIVKLDMPFNKIRDDKDYWLDKTEYEKSLKGKFFKLKLLEEFESEKLTLEELKKHGLNAAPQGPIKVTEQLQNYIATVFSNSELESFPETVSDDVHIFEGVKKTVTVNKYERSSIARAKCIEANGCTCKICGFDFEKTYGDLGKGFIHVHHIVPIHTIGETYKINYETDLIPVCPNCHAMLHKKFEDSFATIDELRAIINKSITS
ncbi:HNH endonuclease [Shewanella algae]|uniref:HNH endonuclease n=1 Tax=Shewanella algae TaxID=38313 RepID=UPI00313E9AE7